jgi:HAE1 family hydrophobic/amphiphilic exporter-1
MWVIDFSIKRPVTTIVAVFLVILFGTLSLTRMPVQMKPTIDKPFITINTSYPAASPQEVEEQITNPIEEKVQAVENLKKLTSKSTIGRSSITLEFDWGADKDIGTIDILKKLNLVGELPEESLTPVIKAISSDEERPVYWASLRGSMPVNKLRQLADDYIKPRLERIQGVGDIRIHGGQEREIRVEIDYAALSARSLSITDIRNALIFENRNVRGGHIYEGKRRLLVRTVGLFTKVEEIESVIIKRDHNGTVYLRDIAKVFDTYKMKDSQVKIDGEPGVSFGIIKKTGENTIKLTEGIEAVMEEVNRELGPKNIAMHESYDGSDYIWDSIDFVVSNIVIGSLFAVMVLVLFLRSVRTTLVVGISIPISIFAAFIIMNWAGRSINTISMVGLAFAVGMVVDNSIVVLENIYRHMELGKPRLQAAYDGAVEIWGAVLASTLTTLAVFLPIIFIQEEAGQLFKDIAITVSCAVGFSMVTAITFIPMMSARVLKTGMTTDELEKHPTLNKLSMAGLGKRVKLLYGKINNWQKGDRRKNLKVIGIIFAAFLFILTLTPDKEYMPQGNRNLIFIVMKGITGMNNEKIQEMSDIIADRINAMEEKKMMFHVVSDRFTGIGMRVKDEWKLHIADIVKKVNGMIQDVPGFKFARAFQTPLFQRSLGKGFDFEIKGLELDKVEELGKEMEEKLKKIDGIELVRSSFDSGNPEYQIRLDRERAANLGISVQEMANVIETMVAGKKATTFKVGGKEYDISLKGNISTFTDYHALENLLIYTPGGTAVPLSSIASVVETTGPTAISHIEMDRALTLNVTIAEKIPLEKMMNIVEREIIAPSRASLPYGYTITLTGAAEDLKNTADALLGSFLLAIMIIYLLMSSLFESFIYPLVILITVPLAAAGAILGVILTGSELNVVTMLGFIILSGIVVNNGILIIHQTLRYRRIDGMHYEDAVWEAVRVRLRPIFMSSITTILGMLPLTFRGGAGSEIYSGLGAAIVGGLATSTIFTLILLPAIYLVMTRGIEIVEEKFGRLNKATD